MTLVLYVPWQGGAILLSDRQGTTRTLTRTPLDKLSVVKPDEIALGYAGSMDKCNYLVRKLSSELLSPDNFPDDYRRVYATCYHLPELGFEMGDVSLIAVAINDARELRVYRVLDAVANSVDSNRCWGIGSGAKYISPHLEVKTFNKSLDEVRDFGLALIAYAAQVDAAVGHPAQYGANILQISHDGTLLQTLPPTPVSLDRVLYKF